MSGIAGKQAITATRIIPGGSGFSAAANPTQPTNPTSPGVFPVAGSYWSNFFFGPQGISPMTTLILGAGAVLFFVYVYPWIRGHQKRSRRAWEQKRERKRHVKRRREQLQAELRELDEDSPEAKRRYVREAIERGAKVRARR